MKQIGRWFFISFLLGAACLIAFAYAIQSHLTEYFQREKQQHLVAQVELAYSQVQDIVQQELAELSVWTEHPLVLEFAKHQLTLSQKNAGASPSLREMDYLAFLIENGVLVDSHYHNTFIFSASGKQLWQAESTYSTLHIEQAQKKMWLEQLSTGKPTALFLTEKVLSSIFFPVLYSVPIVENGVVIAILALELNQAQRLTMVLNAARLSGQGTVHIYNADRQVVLASQNADNLGERLPHQLALPTSDKKVTDQNELYLFASEWQEMRGFGISIDLPRQIVNRDLKKIQLGILVLVFFSFLVMLILIFVVNVSRERIRSKQASILKHQDRLMHVQALAHVACLEINNKNGEIEWFSGFEFLGDLYQQKNNNPKSLLKKLSEFEKRKILNTLLRVQKTQQQATAEVFYTHRGQQKYFSLKFFPQNIELRTSSTLILINDITEQKLQQKEALQAEIEYRDLILQSAHDGIVSVNSLGKVTLCNSASSNMLGFSKNEMLDLSLYRLIEEPSERSLAEYAPCIVAGRRKQPVSGQFWFRRKNGSIFPSECRVNPIIRNGEAVGAVYLFHDISEQLKFERELKEREQRFRRIIEGTSDATFEWDMLEDSLHWNARFWEILGYSYESAQKNSECSHLWQETVVKDDLEYFICAMQAHLVYNENFDVEFRARKADSDIIWLRARGQAIKENGRFIYMSGTISDISNIKAAERDKSVLEEQLRHAQKMEAIGQLTGGIAHDFNNILASVLGYAELVQDCIELERPEKIDSYVEQIIQSGERARDLIRQMMVFSRKDNQEVEAICLTKILNETLSMVRPLIPSTIDIQVSLNAECRIAANAIQLQQILMNLAINAKDAMPDKGKLFISTEFVEPTERLCSSCHNVFNQNMVKISVADTGSGIDAETLKRVFDPYFTTKGLGDGSGMGLSIVHGIVHQLGGHVQARSEIGGGSEFDLYFPIADLTTQDKVEILPLVNKRESAQTRIFIVDDEPSIVEFLTEKLIMNGYQVTGFMHSHAALEAIQQPDCECDILITDQTMPELKGVELVVKAKQAQPNIIAILMTGYSETLSEDVALNKGAYALISKPIDSSELLVLLAQSVAQSGKLQNEHIK
ncbi:hybrid sensor histidine kinase/response regulator [Catenovulum sediminis]|uniref:hybrid sensor histidine kinase/response regulator n=1 Tax=Catenovulum sediminis TaxID=1740262 RepID=UPI00117F3849|nr:PAS domain-containing sensor histidine kinase [Catenovulum sediminis]